MGPRIAILQSSYIPWRGYFDIIRRVDTFVLYDDAQYTKRDWRNRNLIRTKDGLLWLSIPVETKGKVSQRIDETRVVDNRWAAEHWKSIHHHYAAAPHFARYANIIERAYKECSEISRLSEINHKFLTLFNELLGIHTRVVWSTDHPTEGTKTLKLVGLCRALGARYYLSGPSARDYIEPRLFEEAGIQLEYMDYSGYPPYPQCHPGFEPNVSIVDLLLNVGPEASKFLGSR